jgi:hypothetical protein
MAKKFLRPDEGTCAILPTIFDRPASITGLPMAKIRPKTEIIGRNACWIFSVWVLIFGSLNCLEEKVGFVCWETFIVYLKSSCTN